MAIANPVGGPEDEGVAMSEGVAMGDGDCIGDPELVGHGVNDASAVAVGVTAAVPHAPATMTAANAAPTTRILVPLGSDRAGTRSPGWSPLANIVSLFRW